MNISHYDLRSALSLLRENDMLLETSVPVDPETELSGVYRYIGAGGTVQRPTNANGPAMLFNDVSGFPGVKAAIGVVGNRDRVAALLGSPKEQLGWLLCQCALHPIDPIVSPEKPLCQQVVHLASDADFDIRKIVPAPKNTPLDAGPYITMGMCYATHPETGLSDVTIHRLCLQGPHELSIFLQPGSRHIGAMAEYAEAHGQNLPISISIGVDPAIEIASCFEPPTTPLGFNELSIAGAVRQEPVVLTPCISIPENCIANAEFVIEGEIITGHRVQEDKNSHTGYAMPEFPGYEGSASSACWEIQVKAVTHRSEPILQTCIGPSGEHVSMAGIPTEASILNMLEKAMPGKVCNVYAHPSGGGKYMAILQCRTTVPTDEGKQRQAALLAFSAFSELKHIILVDDDVDIFDSDDVLWAMNTRFQGDKDIITIPGVRCHPLDPSSSPDYSPSISHKGISCKTIYDCTVPFHLKEQFKRAAFREVDYTKWLKKD
ncbi:MAG: UbiD family decarboxylase [Oscillospiraceae bacterium]|nr:UbiD family decarboxylase [Oscillospiraceae bacterium]